MNGISISLMEKLVSNDELRPATKYIHDVDGYLCATDNKQLIFVRKDLAYYDKEPAQQKEEGKFPNVLAVANPKSRESFPFSVRIQDIDHLLSSIEMVDEMEDVKVETKFEKCEACDGEGEIEITDSVYFRGRHFELSETVECPICHGYGKVPVDNEYDPDYCFGEGDVKGYKTYETRPTGRKVIPPNLLCIIEGGYYCVKYIKILRDIMCSLGIESISFRAEKNNMVKFKTDGVLYLFMGVYVEEDEIKNKLVTIGNIEYHITDKLNYSR